MALVVEDGSGLANAECYISLAAATARHTSLGNAAWAAAATDSDREAALRRATAYMEQAYRENWKGYRLHKAQFLSWPRWRVWVDGYPIEPNVVPPEVANACADLALKALAGDLNADLTRGVTMKKVGPIETQFDRYSPQRVRYPAVDMALAPFLKCSSASVSLIRS